MGQMSVTVMCHFEHKMTLLWICLSYTGNFCFFDTSI